jgi:hypothetical protein
MLTDDGIWPPADRLRVRRRPQAARGPLGDIHDPQLSGIQSFFRVLHECGNLYELDARVHSVETGHALE